MVTIGRMGNIAYASKCRFKASITITVVGNICDLAQCRKQLQCERQLYSGLHAGPKNAQAFAIRSGQVLQSQTARGTGPHSRDGIAVDQAYGPPRAGIDEHNGCLMRLPVSGAVTRPETCGFESKQSFRLHVSGFDTENTASRKRL